MKIKDLNKKEVVYQHFLKDEKIDIVSCKEEIIDEIQELTGDVYRLKYLGIDSKYGFYLALRKDEALGYSIVQKYFEKYYLRNDKGKIRGEPALTYSLERKKGVGSLLFLVSSLEILKDYDVEVFRCEAVKNNIIDKICAKFSLGFVENKDIFNVYEITLEKESKLELKKKVIDLLKSL